MKNLLLLLILVTNLAFATTCKVDQASHLTSKREVSEVTDLDKEILFRKCTVKFRLKVNGEWHNVKWTHEGYEDGEFLCNTAVENGRKQLLTMLGGTFDTESITVCKEGQNVKSGPVKIGDEVLEAELGKVPNSKYFRKDNALCRLFVEKYNNGVLRVNHGVICQTDNQYWTVVDKW